MTVERMYLGTPQTNKLQVYQIGGRRAKVTQIILSNTESTEAKITLTLNTIDIMKDYKLNPGETQFLNVLIPLKENDSLALQQDKENAINVTISGELEEF
ncbi:hypothetical protein [Bacillus wiedmannii]|uniref:hypothetical protein n=1 Tax=Bacillus wiedmannii TaxID=1890302 RepID=UPI0025A1F1E2|nr:hypothetical protein [Bacillus wiedmannii]MDM5270459.1 hypothetical protein [Bacillus wiedmannii]